MCTLKVHWKGFCRSVRYVIIICLKNDGEVDNGI